MHHVENNPKVETEVSTRTKGGAYTEFGKRKAINLAFT